MVQVHRHAIQKSIDKLYFDAVTLHGLHKTIQNGVEADSSFKGQIGIPAEFFEKGGFVVIVECIDNFIGIPNKSVDGINRSPKGGLKSQNTQRKRSAVLPGNQPGDSEVGFAVQIHHIGNLIVS